MFGMVKSRRTRRAAITVISQQAQAGSCARSTRALFRGVVSRSEPGPGLDDSSLCIDATNGTCPFVRQEHVPLPIYRHTASAVEFRVYS